jgi:hypothetical protein
VRNSSIQNTNEETFYGLRFVLTAEEHFLHTELFSR